MHPERDLLPVTIHCVRFDIMNKVPVVLLKDDEGNWFLPIWIGMFEATQIEIALEKVAVPRPMSHDLMKRIIDEFELDVIEIQIHKLIEGTFYADIIIRNRLDGEEHAVDARPSDAIALALRSGAPILVCRSVIEEAAITGNLPTDDDELEKFRDFLSHVKPDDFKA